MFNRFVNLVEFQSSVKLIVGSVFIFTIIFALSSAFVWCLTYKYNPLPLRQKEYLLGGIAFTLVFDVAFFVLSLFSNPSVLCVLVLVFVLISVEYCVLAKFSEDNARLMKALILQGLIIPVIYVLFSYMLAGFYILFFCMNGI